MDAMRSAFERRFATSSRCLQLFRTSLGFLVALEIADKWPTLEWLYSDVGTLPRSSVMPEMTTEGRLVWLFCAHAWHGSVLWVQFLSVVQLGFAACLACGVHCRASSFAVWWLHCSFCLRNGALVYILDRYLHLLLLYSACLPVPNTSRSSKARSSCSFAAFVLAMQLVLIYTDAGVHKALDPAKAWSLAAPVAALDTYMRHTAFAQAARRMLGGFGLRVGGVATVSIEVFGPSLAFLSSSQFLRRVLIFCVCGMHVGIALCMRNTVLLSSAACIAWIPFLDGPAPTHQSAHTKHAQGNTDASSALPDVQRSHSRGAREAPSLLLACIVMLSAHHQWSGRGGTGCEGRTGDDALRTLTLHQRWNVFSSAESYVVWEIAPARLSDGSVVDLWREAEEVAWSVPTGAEPPRRRGRWRAWPYTAPIATSPESATIFWGSLCDMFERYDEKNRTVAGYHFYMMQADAVPMESQQDEHEYGDVRKRLITKFNCAARREQSKVARE